MFVVVERGQRGRLGRAVTVQGSWYWRSRMTMSGEATRVADPQAGNRVDLGQRPQDQQVLASRRPRRTRLRSASSGRNGRNASSTTVSRPERVVDERQQAVAVPGPAGRVVRVAGPEDAGGRRGTKSWSQPRMCFASRSRSAARSGPRLRRYSP